MGKGAWEAPRSGRPAGARPPAPGSALSQSSAGAASERRPSPVQDRLPVSQILMERTAGESSVLSGSQVYSA